MLQATLTLPGIAGIVLTIGMAVDSPMCWCSSASARSENRGKLADRRRSIPATAEAMRTIIDANVTTLIAAVLLYAFWAPARCAVSP